MAAHQSIVSALCVKIKGVAITRAPGQGAGASPGLNVIPAGTPGIIYGHEPSNPWDTNGKVYHFYPANFDKTKNDTFSSAGEKARIVILAEAVQFHMNSGGKDGPVVHIAIVEAGFTRIAAVKAAPAETKALTRCRLVFESDAFTLKALNGTVSADLDNWYLGRLLNAQPSTSPLFYSEHAGTLDIEFFRQRPLKAKKPAAGTIPSAGALGQPGASVRFSNPAESDSDA